MMAARTGLATTRRQPAGSRGRCCWPHARSLGPAQDRIAVDLGCGEGTDALELLARGWLVLAVDAEPAGLALLRARIPPAAAGRIRVLYAPFAEADLPCAHLIHAGYSLPFCPPQEFPALWARIRRALAPDGLVAGQLFGTRDTWAEDPDMTFHTRHQVETGTPTAARSTGTPSTSSPAGSSAGTHRHRRPASRARPSDVTDARNTGRPLARCPPKAGPFLINNLRVP